MRKFSIYGLTTPEKNALRESLRAYAIRCTREYGEKPPKQRIAYALGVWENVSKYGLSENYIVPAAIVASYEGSEISLPNGSLSARWLQCRNSAISKIARAHGTDYDDCGGIYRLQYDSDRNMPLQIESACMQ